MTTDRRLQAILDDIRTEDTTGALTVLAEALAIERERVTNSDDALLASAMRKLLAEDSPGHVNWGVYDGQAWVTLDVHRLSITRDELDAIERETAE